MPIHISFRPTRVLIGGHDIEGKLILADGQLAALARCWSSPLDQVSGPERCDRWDKVPLVKFGSSAFKLPGLVLGHDVIRLGQCTIPVVVGRHPSHSTSRPSSCRARVKD
jgi:hypothetical protein